MQILDSSHDHFHLIDEPGGYEWTYYDGFSADRQFGFTAIWFRGVPMSPNYSRAIERKDVVADPHRWSAFAFHLYVGRKTVASWLVEGDSGGTDPSRGLRLGGGGIYPERAADGELAARISIDGRSPILGRRVEGNITLRFPPVSFAPIAVGEVDRSITDHYWVPAGPAGTFDAALDLSGRLGKSRRLRFSGDAYHDRNFGFSPLMGHRVEWVWGRLHSRDQTLIFFSVAPPDGVTDDLEIGRALLFRDGVLHRHAGDLRLLVDRAPHWATLPRPSAIRGMASAEGADLRLQVDRPHLLESGPFYHRMLASIDADWGGDRLQGEGTIEYFRPDRLGVRIFRPFVRFRVRRRDPVSER